MEFRRGIVKNYLYQDLNRKNPKEGGEDHETKNK